MKKIRYMSIVLFLISVAAFAVFRIYEWSERDGNPPVIRCPEEPLTVSVADGEDSLLSGVKAEDDRSGDVSDSLVVETISEFSDAGERTVTYAAIDDAGNVGRNVRKLHYTDYQKPRFILEKPLRFSEDEEVNIAGTVQAESMLDGDVSTRIKYSLESEATKGSPGTWPAEFRVTDSAGQTSELVLPVEIYDASTEGIDVSLNAYLVYLNVNGSIDLLSYYAGADREGELDIQGNVNTAQPGVYYADYIVRNGVQQGKSRMIVVVE